MQADEREKEAMLEAEARQEARTLAAEARRKKAKDTLRIEQDARNRTKMAAVSPTRQAYDNAVIQGNGPAAAVAAKQLRQQSIDFADKDIGKESQTMSSNVESIGLKGDVRGVEVINQALSEVDDKGNPKLDKRQIAALTARRDELMKDPKVRDVLQTKAKAKNAIKVQENTLKVQKRTLETATRIDKEMKQKSKGLLDGGNAPVNITKKQKDILFANKSPEYRAAFNKESDANIAREKGLRATEGSKPWDEKQFLSMGDIGMDFATYEASGKTTGGYSNINAQLRARSNEVWKKDRETKPLSTATEGDRKQATDMLQATQKGFRGVLDWGGHEGDPIDPDVHRLVSLAIANNIAVTNLSSLLYDGGFKEDIKMPDGSIKSGRDIIVSALTGKGVKVSSSGSEEPPVSALVRHPDVPEADWERATDEQRKALSK